MPSIDKIQSAEKTQNVAVDFGDGDVLNIVIYPNKLTGKRVKEMRALPDDEDEIDEEDERNKDVKGYVPVRERRAQLFFSPIKSWDLTDVPGGKPLPFTADTVDALSLPTSMRIWQEITDAANPNQKTSKRSRGR